MIKPKIEIVFILVFCRIFSILSIQAQNNNLEDIRLYHDVYEPNLVIDSVYGIVMYEKYNPYMGGDSVRHCRGYACTGFVEDYYSNGQLLHKGFYADGKLKYYTNYYPDGKIEREFRAIDEIRQKLKLYHPNGAVKSEIEYRNGNPVKWKDYYADGQPEFYEELDKKGEYYIIKQQWYPNGQLQSELILTDKKKLYYTQKEFDQNGQLTLEGTLAYSKNIFDYVKMGTWKYYRDGQLVKEETYASGKVVNTKTY